MNPNEPNNQNQPQPINPMSPTSLPPQSSAPAAPSTPPTPTPQPVGGPGKSKNIFIAIAVAVVLIIAGVGITMALSQNDDAKPSASSDSSETDTDSDTSSRDSSDNDRPISRSDRADDSERMTDIKTLQTQLEAFFAENGYYPSFDHLNDSSWRATNLKGLDDEALSDPEGQIPVLISSPNLGGYSYEVTDTAGASCSAAETTCARYTLTAVMSDGSPYIKKDLN